MTITEALDELERSPDFFDHVAHLNQFVEEEKRRRRQFYKNLDEDTKAEFINGKVVVHSPVRLAHLEVSTRVTVLVYVHATRHDLGAVYTEKCLVHCERNDYEPDVCFFYKARSVEFSTNQMLFPPPDLAVEILSPSTVNNDRILKLHDYARHGVDEYWIIDADARMVEQYFLPSGADQYEPAMRLSGSDQLVSTVLAGFSVPIAAFFDPQENQRALRAIAGQP